ncbi:hypothetical protein LB572_02730 [Mesorhizobium sp. BH1-1-5]|uniref:hypothetical protein n=1 Tax=Mesorhizobium sp. BH1-1-5 TaxID=2876661 RepID=UPI001CCAFE5C|nr:hypothetical protein [Mesorhizobium sp. BH1-1-5]MBZ9986006.1 hypothetical protein [Mesorhizobium sp. BH1-1-5]
MEARLLASVGRVAGLAGLALGVFLLIFKEVLQRSLFSSLTSDQSFSVILTIIALTFGISAIGMLAWLIGKSTNRISTTHLLLLIFVSIFVLIFASYLAGAPDRAKAAAEEEGRRLQTKARYDAAVAQTTHQFVTLTDGAVTRIISDCEDLLRHYGSNSDGWAKNDIIEWRDESEDKPTFSYNQLKDRLSHLIPTVSADFQGDLSLANENIDLQKRFNECFVEEVRGVVGDPAPFSG